MTQIFNEFRYYPNKNQKRNLLAHIGMYNIRLPKCGSYISGSEFKEEGSYQYGRNALHGITIGKKFR